MVLTPIQRSGFDAHIKEWFWSTHKEAVLTPIQRSGFDAHTKTWFWWSYKEVVVMPIQRSGFNAHTKKWFGHPYKEVVLMPIQKSGFDAQAQLLWAEGVPSTAHYHYCYYRLLLYSVLLHCQADPLHFTLKKKKIINLFMHAGLFQCFHNPPDCDMDRRIFNVYVIFLLLYTHRGTLFVFARTSLWSFYLYSMHQGGLSLKSFAKYICSVCRHFDCKESKVWNQFQIHKALCINFDSA